MIKGWKNSPAWRAHYEKRQAARVERHAAMCVMLARKELMKREQARAEAYRRVREVLDEKPAGDAGKIVVVEGPPTVLDRILTAIASFNRRVGL